VNTATTTDAIADTLDGFVRDTGQIEPDDAYFSRDVHLFDTGYLDSLGALRVLEFLEATYRIELSGQALADPQFSSVNGMAHIVACALAAAAPR
jgi:D-alanine--poly(phosphoribitol) ligase subunit 2